VRDVEEITNRYDAYHRMLYRRLMRRVLLGSLVLLTALAARGAPDDPTRKTPEQLKKGIENRHPSTYYILAQKLFESGKKDEAVFWFSSRPAIRRCLLRSRR
jgi:hypothetical protein